jgi:polyferredoxin
MKKNILYKIRVITAVCVGILALGAFMGMIYPVKIFDLQAGALLQRVFIDFSIIALALLLLILTVTLLFGRIYCSTLCPFGLLQELIGIVKKKNSGMQKNLSLKYIIAAIFFGTLAGGTVFLLRLAEPYTYFGSLLSLRLTGITAAAIVIIMVLTKDRFFCTNVCPIGAALGLISKISLKKIYLQKDLCGSCGLCQNICPSGCINAKEKTVCSETCIKCLKCLNVCPKNAVKYGSAPKEEVKFSPKRRSLILTASAAAVFVAAAKAGAVIKKTISEKFSDVILPPGALNEERFANKCLNCNLCVKVCPTKIIKKSDKNYGAVSIDYGKNFCEYECNKCCAACPAGALKKLSLEEKKVLRIAMIAPPTKNFKEFGACIEKCPTDALTLSGDSPAFEAMKCIGCGACVATSGGNIKIYGTKTQKRV